MATTTNFGWDTPDDTDYVTDGAAAMRELGQDIDTTLVDLKGGTTGQMLTKASGTDMDFTWASPNPGDITAVTAGTGISGGGTSGDVTITNSMATAIDAKGDLIAGTGADAFSRLAVGNNGETLVADSSTATGLRYQGSQVAAKNAIINGGMDIWQRGTSFAADRYTADRWYQSGGNGTSAQETTTVPDGFRYAMKFTASGTTVPAFLSALETNDSLRFAGQTVCFSAYFASSTTRAVALSVQYSTTIDNAMLSAWTTITATSGGTGTATSTYSRVSGVWAIPSSAKCIRVIMTTNASMATSEILYATGAQLELGSVPTAFLRTGGTIQGELAACQRYYNGNTFAFRLSAGVTNLANAVTMYLPQMRTLPTLAYTAAASATNNISGTPTLDVLQSDTATYAARINFNANAANGDTFYVRAFSASAEL